MSHPSAVQQAQRAADRFLRAHNALPRRATTLHRYQLHCVEGAGHCMQFTAQFYTKRGRKAQQQYLGAFSNDPPYTTSIAPGCVHVHAQYMQYQITCAFRLSGAVSAERLLTLLNVNPDLCVDIVDELRHGLRCISAAVLPQYRQITLEVT